MLSVMPHGLTKSMSSVNCGILGGVCCQISDSHPLHKILLRTSCVSSDKCPGILASNVLASTWLLGLAVSSTVVSICPHPDSCNLFLFWSCNLCPIRRKHQTYSTGVMLMHIQEDYLTNALAPLIGHVGNVELFTNGLGQNDTCVDPLTNRGTTCQTLLLLCA